MNGSMVICLAIFGYNALAAIVFLTLALMFHGAVSSGPLASIVDMSPNYAGIVLGISGMIGVLPGFISSYIVGIMTLNNVSACGLEDILSHLFINVYTIIFLTANR